MKNTAWHSTCIVDFVLEKRKIAMNSSFPRSPDRMILQVLLAMVCGTLISSRAGAVDEPVAPPRPYGPVPSARQLRWHELTARSNMRSAKRPGRSSIEGFAAARNGCPPRSTSRFAPAGSITPRRMAPSWRSIG